jgi:large subunit ribosomal protein L18
MDETSRKRYQRERRHLRVRKSVSGAPERPRLCVFRSLKHIYGQIVDDSTGRTLVTASTLSPAIRDKVKGVKKVEAAKLVGGLVASIAKDKGISKVVFDRAGYRFHGRVKALADAARAGGLAF